MPPGGCSERLERSHAVGERKAETAAINSSLSALGDVFEALSGNKPHVPYRNSKLTYLLKARGTHMACAYDTMHWLDCVLEVCEHNDGALHPAYDDIVHCSALHTICGPTALLGGVLRGLVLHSCDVGWPLWSSRGQNRHNEPPNFFHRPLVSLLAALFECGRQVAVCRQHRP